MMDLNPICRTAAEMLRAVCPEPVSSGLILGSGLGDYADLLENPVTVSYSDIPGFPRSTVR